MCETSSGIQEQACPASCMCKNALGEELLFVEWDGCSIVCTWKKIQDRVCFIHFVQFTPEVQFMSMCMNTIHKEGQPFKGSIMVT